MTLVLLLVSSMPLSLVNGESQDEALALTVYGNGLVHVNYILESDQMEVQVTAQLFGSDIQNLVIRDENGDPLDFQLSDSVVAVDSIGASELHFSYYTESLVKIESGLTFVSINSPVPVSILLPSEADFFDMSHIPTQIIEVGGEKSLSFESGDIFVYYLIGLPKLHQESSVSIENAATYIKVKQSQGYSLNGAADLLDEASSEFTQREYYTSKTLADDALKVAVITVESADQALYSINAVKASITDAQDIAPSETLSQASEQLTLAQNQYDQGDYVTASLTAFNIAQLDLSSNSQGLTVVFQQSIPLFMILGLCSVLVIFDNFEKIPFNLQRGGMNE